VTCENVFFNYDAERVPLLVAVEQQSVVEKERRDV